MFECRFCDVSPLDCGFKRDILRALSLIEEYVSNSTVAEIEEIITASVDKCPDFTPREEFGND